MRKKQFVVIRTAVGSPSSVGMIEILRRKGLRVIGTDCDPLAVGFRFCNKSYVVPRGDSPKFITKMLQICDIEKPDAIISGPEEELLALSKNKERFEKKGVCMLMPGYKTVALCADKLAMDAFFRKKGIPAPRVFRNQEKMMFPLVIKPRFGRGGTDVYKIEHKRDLALLYKKVKNPILQEFVAGIEYTVDIFSDQNGQPLSIIPRIRLQVESGISIKGETVYDREIIEWCKKIAKELKLIGPSCIQCIKSKRGINFIEINNRFGGGSILSIKADPSIMTNLIKIIKGAKSIASKGFKSGLVMFRYYSEVYNKPL